MSLLVITFTVDFIWFLPIAIAVPLKELLLNFTQLDSLLLYSAPCWFNILMLPFAGVLIDQVLGVRLSIAVFTIVRTVGMLIFVSGIVYPDKIKLLIGNILTGEFKLAL